MSIIIYKYSSYDVEQQAVAANAIQAYISNKNVIIIYVIGYDTTGIETTLQKQNIPYCKNGYSNVLDENFFKKMFCIFEYIHAEHLQNNTSSTYLFEILLTDIFKITSKEVATLCIEASKTLYHKPAGTLKKTIYKHVIAIPQHLFDIGCSQQLKSLADMLDDFVTQANILSFPNFIDYVCNHNIIAQYIHNDEHKQNIENIVTAIKNEAAKFATLSSFIEHVHTLKKTKTPLLFTVVNANSYIQINDNTSVVTAEQQYVFLPGFNLNLKQQQIEIATQYQKSKNIDWQISYIDKSENIIDEEILQLFSPLLKTSVVIIDTPTIIPARFVQIIPVLNEVVLQAIHKFSFSASSLNNYLKCPLQFYYYNILKIPKHKNEAFEFGNAIHFALETLFRNMVSTKKFESASHLQQYFIEFMQQHKQSFSDENYERKLLYGQTILYKYYQKYVKQWHKIVTVEKMFTSVFVKNIPIKGKVDKLEFDGNRVTVIDYKSGNVASALNQLQPPNETMPNGGNYWRQAVFYKILIDNFTLKNWQVTKAVFDFIELDETGNFVQHEIAFTEADVETVTQQLQHAWQQIHLKNIFTGCGLLNCYCCRTIKNMS